MDVPLQIADDGEPHGTEIMQTADAIYINYQQIICPIPEEKEYYIQVSNDGHEFSEKLLYYPFDAVCFECAKSSGGKVACDRKVVNQLNIFTNYKSLFG